MCQTVVKQSVICNTICSVFVSVSYLNHYLFHYYKKIIILNKVNMYKKGVEVRNMLIDDMISVWHMLISYVKLFPHNYYHYHSVVSELLKLYLLSWPPLPLFVHALLAQASWLWLNACKWHRQSAAGVNNSELLCLTSVVFVVVVFSCCLQLLRSRVISKSLWKMGFSDCLEFYWKVAPQHDVKTVWTR